MADPESPPTRRAREAPPRDRSWASIAWYRAVQQVALLAFSLGGGVRATGRGNVPRRGGVLLISNHLSYLDVFLLGVATPRPLNYVARSTLFVPVLGPLIRSVGGFPIQREGIGAQGLKETLKRLRAGGIVVLFPEGTRSPTGALGPLKPGIVALATRAGVPVVPAAVAGTFEAWPRGRALPRPHALRLHFGPPIAPGALDGLAPEAVLDRLRSALVACDRVARLGLGSDLGRDEG